MRRLIVGLTGGIASGKSTVAECFAARGIPVIDADVIARQVVEPGQPALDRIVHAFGDKILAPDGRLDRARLRREVFADDALRRRLEEILHPAIGDEMREQVDSAEGPYVVLVVPLLVEGANARHLVDRILVVDVPEETQIRRVMARDGVPREQARAILDAQASRQERLDHATDVIHNTNGIDELDELVEQLHRAYLEMADEPGARDRRIELPLRDC